MLAELSLERSGIRWLLDPESPEVAELGQAVGARKPDTPCDPGAVAADLEVLPRLVRERHFGVATGYLAEHAACGAEQIIAVARDRILAQQPRTWGEAIGDLADQLRVCLHDRHVGVAGACDSSLRRGEPAAPADQDAPAVEISQLHGVLCVRIRRLWGGPDDDRLLQEWARAGLEHFRSGRIIVDLRGYPGGNDAFLHQWIAPVRSSDAQVPGRDAGWYVQDAPLGLWNPAALIEASEGLDALPAFHREHRHHPHSADLLEVREDPGEQIPTGERPWHGQMLVAVDSQTFSSGETSAWALRYALGAHLIGGRTGGALEYGNIAPYLLPRSGMCIRLATKRNDWGIPVELLGLPVDQPLDPATPLAEIASAISTTSSRPPAPHAGNRWRSQLPGRRPGHGYRRSLLVETCPCHPR